MIVTEARANPILQPLTTYDVVTEVALSCLKELAVSLVINGAVAYFTAVPGIILLMEAVIAQTVISACLKTISIWTSHSVCEWLRALNFAILTGFNGQLLLHEAGHYMATLSLFANPRPQIEISPFGVGQTMYSKTALSPLGKRLGQVNVTACVAGSGPAFMLLIASVLFCVGLGLYKTYPQLSKHLIAISLISFFDHAYYAYSALNAPISDINHDFVRLSILDLDPIHATIGIVAIPIILYAGFRAFSEILPQRESPLPVS
jgi:hypothetical protein